MKKHFILVLPACSQRFLGLAIRLFLKTPGTFSAYILCALTPRDYRITLLNQKLFWSQKDFVGNALVGISCATSNAHEGYKIADRFRRAGAKVVIGGVHASYFPDEAQEHCDALVIGEAESVWAEVVRDYENQALKKVYRGEPLDDYFSRSYEYFLKMDPWNLYYSGLILSRGCKYRCEFCVPAFGKLRFIPLDQALALIQRTGQASRRWMGLRPNILFRDDNIFSDPQYAKQLFEKMIPLKVNWTANSSIDIAFDDDALRLAQASGCKMLFIGFETIYPRSMPKTSAGNMSNDRDYLKAIQKLRSYGICVTGAFILGLDQYTHKDYLKLIWFLVRSRLYIISLTILTPFPGSALYQRLQKENRIASLDWRRYTGLYHVVFQPKHMSAQALQLWFVVIRIIGALASPLAWQLFFIAIGTVVVVLALFAVLFMGMSF